MPRIGVFKHSFLSSRLHLRIPVSSFALAYLWFKQRNECIIVTIVILFRREYYSYTMATTYSLR